MRERSSAAPKDAVTALSASPWIAEGTAGCLLGPYASVEKTRRGDDDRR